MVAVLFFFWGGWKVALRCKAARCQAVEIIAVLNGEEEPPAGRLTVVVTPEEPGVLRSDLGSRSDLLALGGFAAPLLFSFPLPSCRCATEPQLPERGWHAMGWDLAWV